MNASELWAEALQRGLVPNGVLLAVDVQGQHMDLVRGGATQRRFVVSTSKNGTGNIMDTLMTPTGWHEVVERYGQNEPAGRVFFERVPTPRVLPEREWASDLNDDLIMTRILRLAGLEDGVNRGGACDTYERYIYVHGSNHEHLMGTPASHGCIHVANLELIELYDEIEEHATWCWIE